MTIDMKTTIVLDLLLVIFLVVVVWFPPEGAGSQFNPKFPSVILAVLYLVFFYFHLRANGLVYLGSSIFSFALIVFVVSNVSFSGRTFTSNEIWEITVSITPLSLNSLEGFKSYLQSRSPSNWERR